MIIKEKFIESMTLLAFSDIKFPVIVVYDHPTDYPDAFVARVWETDGNMPTNTLIKRKTLQEIRDDIQAAGFRTCIPRFTDDDPVVAEIWM